MKTVKEILLNLNLSSKIKQDFLLLELLQKNWTKILEEELSSQTFPTMLKDETLLVEVPNHYVLQNLSGKTLIIFEKLREFLPEKFKDSIKNLRFKINPSLETLKKEKTPKAFSSNSQELKTLLRLCEEIKDPELKKLFIKMFKSYVKLKNLNSNLLT